MKTPHLLSSCLTLFFSTPGTAQTSLQNYNNFSSLKAVRGDNDTCALYVSEGFGNITALKQAHLEVEGARE